MSSASLFHLGLTVLITSMTVRVLMIGLPTYKFAKMFGGNIRQGSSLVGALEINGLKEFIRYECIMGFVPYLALFVALYSTSIVQGR